MLHSRGASFPAEQVPHPVFSRLQAVLPRIVMEMEEEQRKRVLLPVNLAIRRLVGAVQDSLSGANVGKEGASYNDNSTGRPSPVRLGAAVLQAVFEAELKHAPPPDGHLPELLLEVT